MDVRTRRHEQRRAAGARSGAAQESGATSGAAPLSPRRCPSRRSAGSLGGRVLAPRERGGPQAGDLFGLVAPGERHRRERVRALVERLPVQLVDRAVIVEVVRRLQPVPAVVPHVREGPVGGAKTVGVPHHVPGTVVRRGPGAIARVDALLRAVGEGRHFGHPRVLRVGRVRRVGGVRAGGVGARVLFRGAGGEGGGVRMGSGMPERGRAQRARKVTEGCRHRWVKVHRGTPRSNCRHATR